MKNANLTSFKQELQDQSGSESESEMETEGATLSQAHWSAGNPFNQETNPDLNQRWLRHSQAGAWDSTAEPQQIFRQAPTPCYVDTVHGNQSNTPRRSSSTPPLQLSTIRISLWWGNMVSPASPQHAWDRRPTDRTEAANSDYEEKTWADLVSCSTRQTISLL